MWDVGGLFDGGGSFVDVMCRRGTWSGPYSYRYLVLAMGSKPTKIPTYSRRDVSRTSYISFFRVMALVSRNAKSTYTFGHQTFETTIVPIHRLSSYPATKGEDRSGVMTIDLFTFPKATNLAVS